MEKKKLPIGIIALAAIFSILTLLAWFGPKEETSDWERRPLARFPEVSGPSIASGKFMADFENYTLDQFPLRDSFRTVKSMFHYYVLGQRDNNAIYLTQGHAAQLEYPLDEKSVQHALDQFQLVYDLYLKDKDTAVYATVVPDKGFYLAEENGYLAMDYEALFAMVQAGMPWAAYVDITDCLEIADYYTTDTHWRQEKLLPAAKKLCDAMGAAAPKAEDFTPTLLEQPFYGVYYGQAALPLAPDAITLMESPVLEQCSVYNYVTDSYGPVYDMEKLAGKDPYEVYLSGSQSLLRIENPNAKTHRELIIFRDSFGSSLAPLLVQDYAAVTLIDIRYIAPQLLGRYVDFEGKDVLFAYSTLVLNRSLI